MRNTWVNFLKMKYQKVTEAIEEIEDFESYALEAVNEFEGYESSHARLRKFVDRLPEKQRAVLEMRVYGDMSVGQTASELGKDKNYVKTTYQRALISLRNMLAAPYNEELEVQ
jgi:RNA polymerase sigma factor (sigma-70 family)